MDNGYGIHSNVPEVLSGRIGSHCTLSPRSKVDQSSIGSVCTIGPGQTTCRAMLRDGTVVHAMGTRQLSADQIEQQRVSYSVLHAKKLDYLREVCYCFMESRISEFPVGFDVSSQILLVKRPHKMYLNSIHGRLVVLHVFQSTFVTEKEDLSLTTNHFIQRPSRMHTCIRYSLNTITST